MLLFGQQFRTLSGTNTEQANKRFEFRNVFFHLVNWEIRIHHSLALLLETSQQGGAEQQKDFAVSKKRFKKLVKIKCQEKRYRSPNRFKTIFYR